MREILFRGKDLDGIWREGYYWSCDNKCHRIFTGKLKLVGVTIIPEMFSVIPETVGQYTGLTANGTKIFEGDFLKIKSEDYDYEYITKVYYRNHTMCVDVEGQDYDYTAIGFADDIWDDECCEIEVIGNVYDNPELLEGK